MDRILARKLFAGAVLLLFSTLIVLLARNYNLVPERLPPEYRIKGNRDAKIQIEEFSDFACPACAYANKVLKDLMKAYKGQIVLKFKHYPLLSIHKWSLDAAAAADCAGKQGKFFEYGDILFEHQKDWGYGEKNPEKKFMLYAEETGLDAAKFEKCVKNPEASKNILIDMSEGRMKNVDATPTFFINGERAVGPTQLIQKTRTVKE